MEIQQALTFDDVMLVPAASSVLPAETDTRTRITREIELGIPLISAAMDTVTEGALAIAMAQAGGLGVIHRNMPIEQQQAEVRKGKKFEAGRVLDPVTIHPHQTWVTTIPASDFLTLRTAAGCWSVQIGRAHGLTPGAV